LGVSVSTATGQSTEPVFLTIVQCPKDGDDCIDIGWSFLEDGYTCIQEDSYPYPNERKWVVWNVEKPCRSLTLSGNDNIRKEIDPLFFGGLGGDLKSLIMKGMGLMSMPSGIFRGLKGLMHIDLSENNLKALPPKIFSEQKKLSWLSLRSNRLDNIDIAPFAGLKKLATLHLEQNNINTLSC
jgi:hypothetical protein